MFNYTVFHKGQAVKAFAFFVDAWFFALLELSSFSRIRGPSPFGDHKEIDVWVVNPKNTN